MNGDQHKITPKAQYQPLPQAIEFLRGVDDEAVAQGYGLQGRGRLFVAGLRFWEEKNR